MFLAHLPQTHRQDRHPLSQKDNSKCSNGTLAPHYEWLSYRQEYHS